MLDLWHDDDIPFHAASVLLGWTCGTSDTGVGSSALLHGAGVWAGCGGQPFWGSRGEWRWVPSREASPGIGPGFVLHLIPQLGT